MPVSIPTLDIERGLLAGSSAQVLIAIDEVGRGALAGPLTIGAVAIDVRTTEAPHGVRDSKALSAKRRRELAPRVREWAVASCVVDVPPGRIDESGIVRALGEGAVEAIRLVLDSCAQSGADSGTQSRAVVLLDGHHDFISPVEPSYSVHTVVKGDATCASIAAASIIAKVHRDSLMVDLHAEFPEYGWNSNVGYGTKEHRRGLQLAGVSVHHRRSWRLLEEPTLDLEVAERNVDV